MPPPPGAAGAGFFSGFSAITASVVRNRPAIEAAFCSADRVTFAGSMMPALNMSTYSPDEASRPCPGGSVLTFSTTTPPDLRAGGLVARQVELLEGAAARLEQRDAAAGHDTFLDRGLGVAHRVLDAVLALLQLDLGGRPRLDDGDAAGQLGQPLLQLLPVVVRVGVVALGPDLVDPSCNLLGVARALHDRGLVLGDHDLACPAEHVQVDVVQIEADLLADDLAAGEDGDVTEHGLAAVTDAGGLDR